MINSNDNNNNNNNNNIKFKLNNNEKILPLVGFRLFHIYPRTQQANPEVSYIFFGSQLALSGYSTLW